MKKPRRGLIQGDKPSGASGTSNAGKSLFMLCHLLAGKKAVRENGSVIPKPKGKPR